MAEERQAWENKYEADTKKCSQEIMELKFKLRAERIERAELRAENRAVRNAIRALEQSLEKHKDYIIELQEDSVITVSRSIWMTTKIKMESPPIFFVRV